MAWDFSQSTDLLDMYMYHIGLSEVPRSFHEWSCITMIGAIMGDSCYFHKFQSKPLLPNLFLMLIGPSAIGKDVATDIAANYIHEICPDRLFEGRLTAQSVVDQLAERARAQVRQGIPPEAASANLIVLTEELAMGIGEGRLAADMVKMMTKLYTQSGAKRKLQEATRTHGVKQVPNPSVTWMACSTDEWLRKTITRDDILSGFFSRIVMVREWYDTELRVPTPITPPDYYLVRSFIEQRLRKLARMKREFTITPRAAKIRDIWYEIRSSPADPHLYSWWKRADDLVYKLGMIFSVCRGEDFTITEKDVGRAFKYIADLERRLTEIIKVVYASDSLRLVETVRSVLTRTQVITHSDLLRRVSNRGLDAKQLAEALRHLKEEGQLLSFNGRGEPIAYLPGAHYALVKPARVDAVPDELDALDDADEDTVH